MKQYIIIFLLTVASIFIPNNAYGQLLTGAFDYLNAIEYAKTHNPTKSITFQGISSAIIGFMDDTPKPLNGSTTIYFYDGIAKDVIMFDNMYYYKKGKNGDFDRYEIDSSVENAWIETLQLYLDEEGGLLHASKCWEAPYEHVRTVCIFGYGKFAGNNLHKHFIGNTIQPNHQQHNSNGRICKSCSSTGECTACGGRGQYWVDSGIYTGSDSRTLVDCGSCGGSGKCRVCYGNGYIR